ncbi:MAG: formylmethanofuran dehydrogenase subunit C [Candidatus Bathyarchaeota archaeon]|nr:formylmethanofuran dehydrogenase subunit C [Candidatus Bathyarchaeota archaeon]
MIVLTPLKKFQFPIHAECINPDVFQGKSVEEIASLQVWEGNRQKKLGDIFKIEATTHETPNITINGDVSEVRRIGQGMKNGEIVINGDAGMHTGEKMAGGKITINGNAGGWTGSSMKKGLIEIHGNASDYLASPYRGSTEGMRGGKIVVDGNVGSDSGSHLRGGLIKIKGSAGPFLGFHMSDGTIHVEKNAASRLGANMTGGKIVVSGSVDELMPTFTIDSIKPKVKIDDTETAQGPFYVFLGDLAEKGNGKLFISKANNAQLGPIYEKYL